jgi:hypothetical protein
MSNVAPRLLDDQQAGDYIGFSQSFMRNQRYAEVKRIAVGEQPIAPHHIRVGRRIRYTIESLDAWIAAVTAGTHPICTHTIGVDIRRKASDSGIVKLSKSYCTHADTLCNKKRHNVVSWR